VFFTFRDNQTKLCPNSQTLLLTFRETLSGFSADPTSLLKLGVAQKKHIHNTSGGSF